MNPDPLLTRLAAVCTAARRSTVQREAAAVLAWARAHVAEHLVDEAIGWCEKADKKPTLPRAVAYRIQEKAADYDIAMPHFDPTGEPDPLVSPAGPLDGMQAAGAEIMRRNAGIRPDRADIDGCPRCDEHGWRVRRRPDDGVWLAERCAHDCELATIHQLVPVS